MASKLVTRMDHLARLSPFEGQEDYLVRKEFSRNSDFEWIARTITQTLTFRR